MDPTAGTESVVSAGRLYRSAGCSNGYSTCSMVIVWNCQKLYIVVAAGRTAVWQAVRAK
jgi:hypothetical protein